MKSRKALTGAKKSEIYSCEKWFCTSSAEYCKSGYEKSLYIIKQIFVNCQNFFHKVPADSDKLEELICK